jgi:hypothetical protein
MGTTADAWTVGGALSVTGAATVSGGATVGAGISSYIASYAFLHVGSDGMKTAGFKMVDQASRDYYLVYMRAGNLLTMVANT